MARSPRPTGSPKWWLSFVVAFGCSAVARPAPAADVEVHVITMGPGETLFTRAGHLALMVAEVEDNRPPRTRVINYGDTDWDNPHLVWDFFTGELEFFASDSGTLHRTVLDYGKAHGRTVYRQRLRLSGDQIRMVVDQLAEDVAEQTRGYRFHHVEALCTTRVRDLLDQVTGGALRQQLADEPAGVTVQEDVLWAFSDHPLEALAADLFFGRRHHRPIDRYYALYRPDRMREELQSVMVPDPDGGPAMVPLAGEPVVLGERLGQDRHRSPSRASTWFALIVGVVLMSLALDAHRRGRPDLRFAAAYTALGAVIFGGVGTIITLLMVGSSVPELSANEIVLTYPPTDLLLGPLSFRWFRGRPGTPAALRAYVVARLVVAMAALGAAIGDWLIQRPLWLPALSLAFSMGLMSLVLRQRGEPTTDAIRAESAS